jgi:hypothetical protein
MSPQNNTKASVPYAPVDGQDQKPAKGSAGTAKFWIMSLDDASISCSAQFNPKELQIDRTVPWSPPGEAGKENGKKPGGVDLEFTGAKGRSLTVELLFDEYELVTEPGYNVKVAERVTALEKLAQVRQPGSKEEKFRRPHHCVAAWGSALTSSEGNKFMCVIESISTKYTLFDRDGAPLRATDTMNLTQAHSVGVKEE